MFHPVLRRNNRVIGLNNILIVGLGLIGGSYAKALKKQGETIWAIDTNPLAIQFGLKNGLIDRGGVFEEELIKNADRIIFGLYPTAMVAWLKEFQPLFKSGIFLTDVSGVKDGIVNTVQGILREDVEFIGSHPMAGRETSGVFNSDDSIFKLANFIITPTDKNTKEGIAFAKGLGEALGFSHISVLSPKEHDKVIGYLSQLTHAIAVSLMNANDNPHLVEYTGDSFRDLTRIAQINETLWSELFFLNKEVLVPEIDSFIQALTDLKEKVAAEDSDGLKKLFIQSTKRRKEFR